MGEESPPVHSLFIVPFVQERTSVNACRSVLAVSPSLCVIEGTSVTNTIVALSQSVGPSRLSLSLSLISVRAGQRDRDQFSLSFAGATVHDMFNWLTVLVLLPLEIASGMLFHLTDVITRSIPLNGTSTSNPEFLTVLTKPLTEKIVQVSAAQFPLAPRLLSLSLPPSVRPVGSSSDNEHRRGRGPALSVVAPTLLFVSRGELDERVGRVGGRWLLFPPLRPFVVAGLVDRSAPALRFSRWPLPLPVSAGQSSPIVVERHGERDLNFTGQRQLPRLLRRVHALRGHSRSSPLRPRPPSSDLSERRRCRSAVR